jgi:hypothetical protein
VLEEGLAGPPGLCQGSIGEGERESFLRFL